MMLASAGEDILIGLAVSWLPSVITAAIVGAHRGRETGGLLLGLFFGPLGIVVVGLLPWTPTAEAAHRFEVANRLRKLRWNDPEWRESQARMELAVERQRDLLRDEKEAEYGAALTAEARHKARLAKAQERVTAGSTNVRPVSPDHDQQDFQRWREIEADD